MGESLLERPKLRRDLIISPQGNSFVVKDPASGRFFRFREAEHFITQQLDGSTPLGVVRQRVEQTFGPLPAPDTLERFVDHCRRLGFLDTGEAARQPLARRQGMWRGSLLYLRLKAFDPDRLLDRLVGKVRFCFTPGFVVLSAAVILLGLAVSVTNGGEIARDLLRLYRVEMLLVAWLTIFAVTVAHEFAHSLTCKRFGGRVREMGFLLIYFQLAFYCNVSDAWLFREKSKRLWVTFAGPYFELFLWALAVLTWRVTEPGTWLSSVALVVVATSGFKLFINLNPLIKLDGYYLLSDYLEVPNLRARAFGYLRARLKRVWGAASDAFQAPTARERRIYLAYGLLAGTYSFWLLGYVALHVGSFLVERYQGAGAVLWAGLLLTVFQNPLKRALPKPLALFPAGHVKLASLKGPAKLLVLLTAVAVLFLGRMELRVAGEFKVLPLHNADVRAQVDGLIEEIYVAEGERVSEGDPIARLSERDNRAELRKVEAEIDEARARLRMLTAGPRQEEIELARKSVETGRTRREQARMRYEEAQQMLASRLSKAKTELAKAEERLRFARNDLDRFKALIAAELVSRREFEEAEERVAVREKEVEAAEAELKLVLADDLAEVRKDLAVATREAEEAEARLTLVLAGSRAEEIQVTEAVVVRLAAQRRYLREQLELANVASPISGVVTTPKPKDKRGQHVKKGDLILEVHELKTITAEIATSEKEIGDVKVGQQVVLKARAFPEESFSGVVTAIAPAAVREEESAPWRGKVVRVTTEIDNAALRLKPEMTGNAKILCGQRRIVDIATRRLARYVRVEFWSWW